MITKLPRLFLVFISIIFTINLLQAHFTELIFDEAYYWYFAQNMAWGYFDHPPMVALLIKISSFLFDGELGVRFMSCLLSIGTLFFLWQMIDSQRKKDFIPHFFVLALSMTLLNAYGFFTLPDTPLLFFTALFLWVYKKFIQAPSLLLAVLMGTVMAALMYSKYHAILVILFVLLSNLKLVFNKYAWLAVVVSLLCYTPHIYWLYENDFVSIKYHLFERPNRAYEFADFTLGYFINLAALFGLTFPWIYMALFKTKATDKHTKALLYLSYGVLFFFFLSSFQRRVQTQWIIVICIPMVVIVFNYMLHNDNARKWIYRTGIANIAILLFLRLGLIFEPLFPVVYESHGNEEWVSKLQSQIGDIPVVFENSYRRAPMYAFYSGNASFSLNNIYYRKNQYSIDSSEEKVQHKKIAYVSKYLKKGDVFFKTPKGTTYYGIYKEDFESFRKLQCFVPDESLSLGAAAVTLKVYNPYEKEIDLNKLDFKLAFLNNYKQVKEVVPLKVNSTERNLTHLRSKDTTNFTFDLPKTSLKDPRFVKVCISENDLYCGLNGETIKLD